MPISALPPLQELDGTVTQLGWDNVHLSFHISLREILSKEPIFQRHVAETRNTTQTAIGAFLLSSAGTETSDSAPQKLHKSITSRDIQFFLVDKDRVLPLETTNRDVGSFLVSINITNFKDRRQIPNGSWKVVPVLDGQVGAPLRINLSDSAKLPDFSRVFLYNQNFSSYTISFGVTEDDFRPEFLLRSYQFDRGRGKKKNGSWLKRIKKKVMGRKRRITVMNAWYRFWRRLYQPTGRNLLFASEARATLGGNLSALNDRLVERGLDEYFSITTSFLMPEDRTIVRRLSQVKQLAQTDILVIDDYFPSLSFLKISPKTKIIQAWHAGSGFKAVGYSRFGNYGSPALTNAHRKYTYAIAGSTSLVPVYAENFGIEEQAVIPTGLPRIDKFLNPGCVDQATREFYDQFPAHQGKELYLFAPTFRGRGMQTAYYDYERIDFDALYASLPDNAVVGFRMHHFVKEAVPIRPEHADKFFDLTNYSDGLGLLHVVDLLITDYSSIIYEYSLLNKPMLFFAYDRDIYSATRGFHRDYEETAPGKVCLDFPQLLTAIREQDFEMERLQKFRNENFDNVDVHSSDRFIDWLLLGKRD